MTKELKLELVDLKEEKRIDALRIKLFKTNSKDDKEEYFNAINKYFQRRYDRRLDASYTKEYEVLELSKVEKE